MAPSLRRAVFASLFITAAADACLECAKLLRHQLELARQRSHLRLDRVDSGGEAGGTADPLAGIAGGAFLRQGHVRPRLHQRFERRHHGLKIGNLLLEPADAVSRRRSCSSGRLRSCRRGLLRYRLRWLLLLLGKHRGSTKEGQKQRSCQYTRQARSAALNQDRRGHGFRALSEL